ncbi:mRNA cap guanine-N(7) methyltransferase 1 isoform X2 [Arachis hypogaea]
MPDANVIIKKLREAEGLAFGNSVYWVRFDEVFSDKKFKSSSPFGIKYTFHLESLAEEYDFELIFAKNSHEFVHEYLKKPEFVELMQRLGALGDGNQDKSTLSADEWEAAYLYMSFVLRKRDQPERTQVSGQRKRGLMHISEQDIMYISSH